MSHQIIKQPNGRYSIYSSIVERIICYQMTKKEIKKYYKKEAIRKEKERVNDLLNRIESGKSPYYKYALSWEDVKKTIPKEWL